MRRDVLLMGLCLMDGQGVYKDYFIRFYQRDLLKSGYRSRVKCGKKCSKSNLP